MINKTKLLNHIEKEFNIKPKVEEIYYYTGFNWRNDLNSEMIKVYIGSRTEKLDNDMMSECKDYILVKSDEEIYLLLKNNKIN